MKSELITVVEPLVSIPTLSRFTPDQQAVLDRLEMYPAATFRFDVYTTTKTIAGILGLQGPQIGVSSGHPICFTCVAGWTGYNGEIFGDRTEGIRLRQISGDYRSLAYNMMFKIQHWGFHYPKFRAPFNQYDGTAVPKAVVIDAVRRVFAGESILA